MKPNKLFILTFALCSVFMLSACGSKPKSATPWAKPDDSPWKEQSNTVAQSDPAEEVIYQPIETMSSRPQALDYEPMAVPEPAAQPAPMRMDMAAESGSGGSTMPMPESVQAETMVMDASTEDVVMAMPAGSYAVQVSASKNEEAINRFKDSNSLDDLKVLKTDRSGEIYYVLIGLYDNRAAADEAAAELEQKLGSKPWVRSMPGLQKIVAIE